MSYGEVTHSDIDSAVSRAKSDLDYDIRRGDDELRSLIHALERRIDYLENRVRDIDSGGHE